MRPARATAIATTLRRMIGSPSVTRASNAASTGASARMNKACDACVVESRDEAARRGRDAQRHADAREPDRPERLHHPAALDDRDVDEQRSARERRPAEDLGGRVERELALKDASRRPRDRGERDIDLSPALAPQPLERRRPRRHTVKC